MSEMKITSGDVKEMIEKDKKQRKKEIQALSKAMIERLGKESPVSLLVSDRNLFQWFAKEFLQRNHFSSNTL